MKASDHIVDFLIKRGISDVFGYPGGMVTHLMDSLDKRCGDIETHITYHEQAAAFAACGYSQSSGKVGVAFATSGPGATNLLTGVGQAYFDSIPVIFLTGQVNTFESGRGTELRQRGFQETDIVSMAMSITKYAKYVSSVDELVSSLDEAYEIAVSGRPGPVLLDIPMDVMRSDIDPDAGHMEHNIEAYDIGDDVNNQREILRNVLREKLGSSKRPCILIGNGIRLPDRILRFREIIGRNNIPVVSSLMAVDVIPNTEDLNDKYYGFIGAYGNRTANFTVAKSDLLICIGSRLDVRQAGAKRKNFAPDADIIRIDIDRAELNNKIRDNDINVRMSVSDALDVIDAVLSDIDTDYLKWLDVCREIKDKIKYTDEMYPNKAVNAISRKIPDGYSVVADVGQNMIWTAQSFRFKPGQRLYMSGGMGSMGYALPAAIGIYYATGRPVICFIGDGGMQMNIQELQYVYREHLPIKIIVMNNMSLGMIRHFQEMYFAGNYCYTVAGKGYDSPDFVSVGRAYGIKSAGINGMEDLDAVEFADNGPELIEVALPDDTVVRPKLEFGKPNQDQEPLLDRELYDYLMSL